MDIWILIGYPINLYPMFGMSENGDTQNRPILLGNDETPKDFGGPYLEANPDRSGPSFRSTLT